MPATLTQYILQYGYLAVFLLIFLQELGVPNPISNELVLLFSGYLASIHTFSFTFIFLTAVSADFIGTSILFFVFYYFGEYLLNHKPKWIPISRERIESLTHRISQKGMLSIYIGRLIPYLRGYTSVAAGLLRIRPKVFISAVIISAITWSGGYVLAGWILGPYWQKASDAIGGVRMVLFTLGIIILFFVIKSLVKYDIRRQKSKISVKN